MKQQLFLTLVLASLATGAQGQRFRLPKGVPSSCYTYDVQEPRWQDTFEKVAIQLGRYQAVPAERQTITATILVQPAHMRLEVVPGIYETIYETYQTLPERRQGAVLETRTESIMVKGESKRITIVPAQFETITVQEMTHAAMQRFSDSCETCPCKAETVPAAFTTITKQVLRTPATVTEEIIPAEYLIISYQAITENGTGAVLPAEFNSITKQVLQRPETVREQEIPAVYTTITKIEIIKPAQCLLLVPDDGYVMVNVRKLVQPASYTKRVIPCKNGATVAQIKEIQVPAVFKTIGKRTIEVSPAYTRYQVVQAK